MTRSLDAKLAEIHADPDSNAFILADAKDADMAFGIAATGKKGPDAARSLEEYREVIRQNTRQGLLDIMLMSVSNAEQLVLKERLFDGSAVTPAIRANDTTEIHAARGSHVPRQASRPFRTALLDHAQCGRLGCDDADRSRGVDLGLYSITFNNDVELDRATLEAYKAFRVEAEQKGFRHFLEVFDPNAPAHPVDPALLGGFVNDLIVRALAGVASAGRPLFLKMVYHGPKFTQEMVHYDPHLVVGILGGSAGTTYDAFKMLAEAKKYGAKAALYGRKINNAEHQLSFIQFLRYIADGQVGPEEAVRAYHGVLAGLGIKPRRPLHSDMQLTEQSMSYASGQTISIPSPLVTLRGRPAPRTPDPAAQSAGARPPAARPSAGGAGKPVPASSAGATPGKPAGSGKPFGAQGKPFAAQGKPPTKPAGQGGGAAPSTKPSESAGLADFPRTPDGKIDFARMTPQQRLDYHRRRMDGTLGI